MTADRISSRKNAYIAELRALASDGAYRRERGEYVCDGEKLLREALDNGAEIVSALWRQGGDRLPLPDGVRQLEAADELFDYASPMKNSPGPVFTVRLPIEEPEAALKNALLLEDVQDPGNVGTVIRTASAFGVDAVILVGACADVFSPKAVRSSMGAVFRQRILHAGLSELPELLRKNALPLYGAALSETAEDIRRLNVSRAAVAVGSEGRGLSEGLLDICSRRLIIPMAPCSESLNAAAAAAVIMWEMCR